MGLGLHRERVSVLVPTTGTPWAGGSPAPFTLTFMQDLMH